MSVKVSYLLPLLLQFSQHFSLNWGATADSSREIVGNVNTSKTGDLMSCRFSVSSVPEVDLAAIMVQ